MDNREKPKENAEKRRKPNASILIGTCSAYKERLNAHRRGTKIADRIPNIVNDEVVIPNKQSQGYIDSTSPYPDKDRSLEYFNDQVLLAATKIVDDLDSSIEKYQRYSDYLKLQLSELMGDVENYHRITASFETQKKNNKEVENWKAEVTTILEEMQHQQELLEALYQKNVKKPDPCEELDSQQTHHEATSVNTNRPRCPPWRSDPLGYIYCVWKS